ncbi:hypothetical protein SAMD00019534_052590 [Acytostelium subglobosum LB1]|uniref:hypothetical protein n=1 Tax=Acytostelium subglobosum LB1 TaxID=1410327 RepID=UPI00064491CB|nr:hypothetical protein SAMD00019534_052590 [Acytostelium subglobosum LB1]GAM22084.1 hypothetical protein SAMD00019534_052590 [Acytostelium subglobosum LB1]|eukprot:XP_012755184.1 hypothetical protein SAMD00019534_052590 [Acytostelium subglobosum LB1]
MARSEEKAQSMLNRFLRMRNDEDKIEKKRPHLASLCENLTEAERWRHQIIREMSRKISEIQNSSLGEYRIRDLNDEINKLGREKHHWEKRIIQLGGPNYLATQSKIFDADGREAAGKGHYKYYGEARNLPGVKEMLEKPEVPVTKRSKFELHKSVDADYYGYRDDEDGLLEEVERDVEKQAIEEAVAKWKDEQRQKYQVKSTVSGAGVGAGANASAGGGPTRQHKITKEDIEMASDNNNNAVEKTALEKKKEDLKKRYG